MFVLAPLTLVLGLAGPAVTVCLGQTTPTITWTPPAPIAHGTPLSAAQLNATASVTPTVASLAATTMGPVAVTVDASGTLYVAEYEGARVLKITSSGTVTTLASPGALYGIAVDPSGTVYVSDISNHRIQRITSAGIVSTLAGNGTKGSADGTGTAARFYYPCGLALDAAGVLYVADRDNHRIRRINPSTGQVTTLAGSTRGAADGQGTAAQFNTPWGVAVDSGGTVYVADAGNARVRTITPAGQVATLAGSDQGFVDGTGTAARFKTPWGVAVDSAGWVYVADAGNGNGDFFSIGPGNNRVRVVSPTGVVTTLAGNGGGGLVDGTGTSAQFAGPRGVAVGPSGIVYVADQQNNRVRTVTRNVSGTLTYTPPAGTVLSAGAHTLSVTFTPTDTTSYTSATATVPLLVNKTAPVVTWATPAPITYGTPLSAAQLNAQVSAWPLSAGSTTVTSLAASTTGPVAVAVDAGGTLYVAEYGGGRVLVVTPSGSVTTLASPGSLYGIAVDPGGTVYVSDIYNHRIRRITPAGAVTTLAGSGIRGTADGAGTSAQFYHPCGLALDAAGMLYVADRDNHRIRKIDPSTGHVTTLAGSTKGSADGQGTAAQFNTPWGVAVDSAGTVYVADAGNYRIRTITPTGQVATLAGAVQGFVDATGTAARFATPWAVAVDRLGWVYVADAGNGNGDFFSIGVGNNRVRRVSPTGVVTTVAGNGGGGLVDGAGTSAQFAGARGLAVAPTGTLYVADQQNDRVRAVRGNVPGTFTYAPPAGAVLPAGTPALSVTFTPTDSANYSTATGTVQVLVNKATPTVTWAAPAPIVQGTPLSATQLNASASVPGTFVYSPPAGTLLSAGAHQTLSVTFTPADTANYVPVTQTVTIDVLKPPPVVAAVVPAFGPVAGGTWVTVSGTGFAAGAALTIGGAAATNVTVADATSITAMTPAHAAGAVAVVVTNTDAQTGTLASGFTYVAAPAVTLVEPPHGPLAGGTQITITGTGFVDGQTTVSVGGAAATSVAVTSATQVSVVAPAHARGAVDVAVTTPGGTSTAAQSFTYENVAAGLRLDFDGDLTTDVSVYRPSSGDWFVLTSASGFATSMSMKFGAAGDQTVLGDFDGDGKRDAAVYRPATGTWFWLKSSIGNTQYSYKGWGVQAQGDVPAPGDFDGDGKTDPAVYRPATGLWFILRSASGYSQYWTIGWGSPGDQPMPGDYDGDGRSDVAVYRASTGEWFVLPSSSEFTAGLPPRVFGGPGDVPLIGDYDGDGKQDLAVYRPSSGTWFWLKSSTDNSQFGLLGWGLKAQGDVPAPGDYDSDGTWDAAIYRPGHGTWFVLRSSSGNTQYSTYLWGQSSDLPLGGSR